MPPALPSAAPASLTTWMSPGPAPVRARSRASPAITPPGNRRIARGAAARALVRGHSMISRRTQSTGQDQDGLRAAPVPANAVARFLEAAPFSFAPAGLGILRLVTRGSRPGRILTASRLASPIAPATGSEAFSTGSDLSG